MMIKHRTYSRVISFVMALIMVMLCVPVASVSARDTADSTQQIEFTGGWNPADYPIDGTLYKDRIAVSKTIAPTENENYFDITLEIVAKPRVIDQSIDVVVVMDVSNTMNSTHQGLGPANAGYNIKDARLTHAKAAVSSFLDLYSLDNNISEDRRFGLVTFNSYANTIVPLTTLNTKEKAEEVKLTVNAITAPTGNRERFTNIEGGLQLAHNLLKESDAAFKYIIFITDGFPTTYIESGRDSLNSIVGYDTYMTGSYNASKVGTDGYFADSVTKKLCTYGVNYSDKAADRADDVAKVIKNSGINIFSIGIDVGVQSIPDYLNSAKNTAFTTIDRTSTNHVIGNTTDSYKGWLRDSIAGGPMIEEAEDTEDIHRYASGNSSEELRTAFENILKDIELIPAETMEEAFTLDPMSDYVEFINFYDLDGSETQRIVNTRNGKDVASFNTETETIKWWLTTTQNFYIDDIGNYVLSISYRVRLKNEMDGFEFSKAFETNEETTFYFKTMDFTTGEPLYGDNHINYLIPKVEGYYGNFSFTKVDDVTGHPLEGAEFTLMHYGESCHICEGDAYIESITASSDEDGTVSFENLPSGHEYVLMETKAPEGYAAGAHHSVHIAYGKTYFDGALVTENAPAVVINSPIEPVTVSLNAVKTLIGRELKDGEFTFMLEGMDEFGNKFHERIHNDAEGKVVFYDILFDKEGVYNFRVYELQGKDSTVVYDQTVYEIEFEISLSDDGAQYVVETKVNGEDVENDRELVFEFTNSLRKPVEVEINAEKLFDGEIPEDGLFNFELKDDEGNLLQSKTTSDGIVTFDKITYNEAGIYRYTINESHECTSDEAATQIYFDHRVYDVIVKVSPVEDGDSFSAEVKYYSGDKEIAKVLFENETRGVATLKLNGIKFMDGEIPEEGRFSFELREINCELVERVENDAEGNVSFASLEFNRTGYFVFVITEVKGTDEDVIYDDTVYTVFVVSEAHHNLSNYYLDVTVSIAHGDEFEEVSHYYGSDLTVGLNGGIEFDNFTDTDKTEPSTAVTNPIEEPTTMQAETTEATEPAETQQTTVSATEPAEPTIPTTSPTTSTEPTETQQTTVSVTEPVESQPQTEAFVTTEAETTEAEEEKSTEIATSPNMSEATEKTEPADFDTVKTGDTAGTLQWVAVLFVMGAASAVVVRKRKTEE